MLIETAALRGDLPDHPRGDQHGLGARRSRASSSLAKFMIQPPWWRMHMSLAVTIVASSPRISRSPSVRIDARLRAPAVDSGDAEARSRFRCGTGALDRRNSHRRESGPRRAMRAAGCRPCAPADFRASGGFVLPAQQSMPMRAIEPIDEIAHTYPNSFYEELFAMGDGLMRGEVVAAVRRHESGTALSAAADRSLQAHRRIRCSNEHALPL